ncbi:MAG: hypothetical protein QHJ73_02420 [Armatimonadota bacterium]|nr:hypothetical protein [Armatimonadota bacterium]
MRYGIATRDITPPFPTSMGGYGARRDYFDGVNDPLTLTCVVLEEGDRRALLVAADLISFPGAETPALRERLAAVAGCRGDAVVLNASHTHGGPKLPSPEGYSLRRYDMAAARRYAAWLFQQVEDAAGAAAASLAPGSLWYGEGRTTLPMNRRPDRNGQVPNAPNPGGPVDSRMQVLLLRDAGGAPVAVGMKVSCHPVATGAQHLITADFPGAWRAEFARAFGPRVTPFFLQGAGADARPRHVADGERWRQMKHAELWEIGRDLMAECLTILVGGGMEAVGALDLQARVQKVEAPCETRYTERTHFEQLRERGGLYAEYAEECIARLDRGEAIPASASYQVQTLWLSKDLALIGIDAEPLCGLGRVVEAAAAPAKAILLGYTNGCVSYVPDTAEMKRGGYETDGYLYHGWAGPLLPGLEHLMANAVWRPES